MIKLLSGIALTVPFLTRSMEVSATYTIATIGLAIVGSMISLSELTRGCK